MTNKTRNSEDKTSSTQQMDVQKDNTIQKDNNDTRSALKNSNSKSTDTATNDKSSPFPDDTLDLAEQYKDLQHYTDSSNHHPIPSLPPMPHHAPPQDSSELLSPWWSEEPPEIAECDSKENSNNRNHHHADRNEPGNEELSHFLVKFKRQATDKKTGQDLWQENCYLWSKEPRQQTESNLIDDIKAAGIGSSSLSTNTTEPSPTKKTYPLNSQCAMVCLFRESQERKKKKRQDMNVSSSWNPFYGNWLVVALNRSGFIEHLHETDITKKNSPDYYTVELGERLGRTGQDATHFMTKTFTPLHGLGRRYIESWKDGTQVGFFTRFLSSAKRGDAFYLLRDSARRMVENMVASEDKKKDDDDHRR